MSTAAMIILGITVGVLMATAPLAAAGLAFLVALAGLVVAVR